MLPCPICETPFKPYKYGDGRTRRTCSRTCGNKLTGREKRRPVDGLVSRTKNLNKCHRRAERIKAATVERVDRLVVFERDGWICHLCTEPVDRTLSGRDRLGPTLDHVVPLSRGGEHSYANVKLAHRRCNVRRGVRLLRLAA